MSQSSKSDVLCPTADKLFEKFAEATHEHFVATDDLSMLTACHEAFAEAQEIVDEKRLKSLAARQALEQHWKKHGCRIVRDRLETLSSTAGNPNAKNDTSSR